MMQTCKWCRHSFKFSGKLWCCVLQFPVDDNFNCGAFWELEDDTEKLKEIADKIGEYIDD